LFWPDLATAHYARQTQDKLCELGVNFIPKPFNPPNVPQLRPIERFWAILKAKVYRNCWEAKNLPQLQRKIQIKLREFILDTVRDLMEGIRGKVRRAGREGADAILL
jgi:transposase